jgi:hypothetical protein
LGSRLDGATEADVALAYETGSLVRGWPMRGTVHVTAAEDLRWMVRLAGVRTLRGVERRWAHLGIDEALLERARTLLTAGLAGGRARTRVDLARLLADAGIEATGGVMYHIVWYLTTTGTLCMGPIDEGGDHAMVLQDEHLPPEPEFHRPARLAELARRYLAAHGPAQVDDLVWWAGITKGDAKAAFAAIREDTVEFAATGGRTLWMLADAWNRFDPDCSESAASMLALAPFDEHLLGYKDRSDVLDADLATAVDPARNGVFRATIVEGGRVIGTWARKQLTNHTRVTVTPFGRMTRGRRRSVEEALGRWSAFVGGELEVEFS